MDRIQAEAWFNEKLQRKINQEFEMARLAHQDGDHEDSKRRMELAKLYSEILKERR